MLPSCLLTFPSLFFLVEHDEEVPGAFRAEWQHDGLQYRRQDGYSQKHRPQSVGAEQKLQTKDLKHTKQEDQVQVQDGSFC